MGIMQRSYKGIERITTAELIEALCSEDERPWATYNHGKPITPRQIAKLLKDYGIHSKNLKISYNNVSKGFECGQFTDAFARYLSSTPENSRYPLPLAETLAITVADREAVAATSFDDATSKARGIAIGSVVAHHLGVTGGERMVEVVL